MPIEVAKYVDILSGSPLDAGASGTPPVDDGFIFLTDPGGIFLIDPDGYYLEDAA